MTVALGIEVDGVNIDLAASLVGKHEVLWHPSRLRGSVVGEYVSHPGLMSIPHDEVQVFVWACLLTNQCVDTPAAIKPCIDLSTT